MNEILVKEVDYIKKDLPKLSELSQEYLFSLVCYKYFFNEGYLSIREYKQIFVDGKDDGGIDLIFVYDQNAMQSNLVLVQSKCISILRNKQDVIDIFTKMDQTIRNFKVNKTSNYNERLKRIFKENLAYSEDTSQQIELVLFMATNISDNLKTEIEIALNNITSFELYKISIYYEQDIINQIQNTKEPQRFVPQGKLKYFKDHGRIKYGENGLLINISAISLRDLYDRFKDTGLFEQNFRYYFNQKKIDENINKSLDNKRNDFWFLNNGIIIGCSDFESDGDEVKLWDFSIINGGQTTSLIGKYKGKNQEEDFAIPCKIVKANNSENNNDKDNTEKFISEIAEASNSQKPISDRDLKSNSNEQRNLKQQLLENNPQIYLEIKKGEQRLSRKNKEEWQFIKNDLLGQLILSYNFQQPGTARSNKSKIFSDNIIYHKVFRRKHDINGIVDLLKLDNQYSLYCNEMSKENIIDQDQESVILNGKLFVIAIIGFMIKMKRGIADLQLIKDNEIWELEVTKDNIAGSIFLSDYSGDDFYDILHGLFSYIVYQLYSVYNQVKSDERTVSNFFKTDTKYRNIILRHIIQMIYQNKIEFNKINNDYLKIFL